jgi:alpha-1,2-mannosyltransferase
MDVATHFQYKELPRLLNATNLIVKPVKPVSHRPSSSRDDEEEIIDLAPIRAFGGLRLCLGKEWYRFPSHYLIPDGVNIEFIKSDFRGLLPGHFTPSLGTSGGLWRREKTWEVPSGFNDLNKEEPSRYVSITKFLFDVLNSTLQFHNRWTSRPVTM